MDIADKIKFLRTNILDISQDKFAKKNSCYKSNYKQLGTRIINTNNSSY